MDLSQLTIEMDKFVEEKRWYTSDSKKPQTPKNLAASLMIETAEVMEHLQWSENITNLEDFSEELADVSLYLLQLAKVTGVNLEEAILRKLDKNRTRAW